ncbi:MAG: hypothetical protein QOE36_3428 [Gaiellaceae bacterium]|nr:hypothetical protein [Gaiellaceae bacterium]
MNGFLKGCAVGGVMGALVLASGAALAGTGIGAVFNLGQTNTVNKTSILAGSTGGAQALFYNGSTLSNATGATVYGKSATAPALDAQNLGGGPALGLHSGQGHAPLTVDSTTKVTNLNADRLDGSDSTAFFPSSRVRRIALPLTVPHTQALVFGDLKMDLDCKTMSGGPALQFSASTSAGNGEFQLFWGNSVSSGGSGLKQLTTTQTYTWPLFYADQVGTFVYSSANEVQTGTVSFRWSGDTGACFLAGLLTRSP